MKARLKEWFDTLSGQLGKDYYACKAPGEPGWCIVKKKPGPRNPRGKRKNLWVMPEAQAKCVRSFKNMQQQASLEYADQEKRAQWQAEYVAWRSNERRHGKEGNLLNGKKVRFLWDYVRIRLKEINGSEKTLS